MVPVELFSHFLLAASQVYISTQPASQDLET
jgi:hypothetical protein